MMETSLTDAHKDDVKDMHPLNLSRLSVQMQNDRARSQMITSDELGHATRACHFELNSTAQRGEAGIEGLSRVQRKDF